MNFHSYLFWMIVLGSAIILVLRLTPFVLFQNRTLPRAFAQLIDHLPAAIMAILVIYCLADVPQAAIGENLATFLAIGAILLTHWRFQNDLLSIAVGTISYMVFLRILG